MTTGNGLKFTVSKTRRLTAYLSGQTVIEATFGGFQQVFLRFGRRVACPHLTDETQPPQAVLPSSVEMVAIRVEPCEEADRDDGQRQLVFAQQPGGRVVGV